MKLTVGLTIDFGNSESRFKVIVGNHEKLFRHSNRFAKLPTGYEIPKAYVTEENTVFTLEGENYANGLLADREFSYISERPYAFEAKSKQRTTEYTLNLVIARTLMYLEEIYNIDANELDVTFNVSVVVPPLEVASRLNEMKELIRKVDKVRVLVPKFIQVPVKIGAVEVFPEGVSAFFGAFFNESGNQLVEEVKNKEFETGYVLVVDIGAGTTDLALIQDSTLVENSMDTFQLGGNAVQSRIEKEIKLKYNGHKPTQKEYIDLITTGYMALGGDKIDVLEIINKAKEECAKDLIGQLGRYFEGLGVGLGSLKGLLVIGGGSLSIEGEIGGIRQVVSPPMSQLLQEFMGRLNGRTKLMYIGDKNPRLLNIEGLTYMHKHMG